MRKIQLLSILLAFACIPALAYDFKVNGFYFNKTSDNTVEVTSENNKYPYNSKSSFTGALVIPASVKYAGKTYAVNGIGWFAFKNCTSLTSIVIPNSVTKIGGNAFENCSTLKSVVIPNYVTNICWYAFSGCSSLTTVSIPKSVTTIDNSAFAGCNNLTTVILTSGMTEDKIRSLYAWDGRIGFQTNGKGVPTPTKVMPKEYPVIVITSNPQQFFFGEQ